MQGELTVERLLAKMHETEASDLHIKIGSPPVYRVGGTLHHLQLPPLDIEATSKLLTPIIPARLAGQLEREGGIDFSYTDDLGRFRCNVFHSGGGLHAAIRRVNSTIPEFEDLHLPSAYKHVSEHVHDGLVLICGVTGSGKSSTMASMINYINRTHGYNIITIEDPVEYLIKPVKSVISQREVGIDVVDFPTALRSAVRQDPDVIVLGEMRDKETLRAGLMAAETGHLVYVTLHTTDVVQSFSRILEFFPIDEQAFIRSSLALSLRAVLAQRLLPSVQPGVRVVPATEVLLRSPLVSDCIRESREEDLYAVIADSKIDGMHTFTDSLAQLVEDRFVDLKVAEDFAPHPEQLRSKVLGIEVKADGMISRLKHHT